MSKKTRMILITLSLVMALILPFVLPSGAMLGHEASRLNDEIWQGEGEEGASLLDWLIPRAKAETAALPFDFSPGKTPDPARFTDTGYEDDSIKVSLETLEKDGVTWRIARVDIAHASQLRTGIAGSVRSPRYGLISEMSAKQNAILAINANYLTDQPQKKTFEYRMGERIRAKGNRTKDALVIDEQGDFHLYIKVNADKLREDMKSKGRQIINAFTFGPALVKDGELLTLDSNYGWNPHGDEPRMAIGQVGPLSYVLALAEGRRKGESDGVTHKELADFMFDLSCMQAFNLDGGNSATMVFNGQYYQTGRTRSNERAQSDYIYFATATGQ
jgi:exopolysaccharide biosynthesis protein